MRGFGGGVIWWREVLVEVCAGGVSCWWMLELVV